MNQRKGHKRVVSHWKSTATQNLVRNSSSGTYYARFRIQGKLTWKSLETTVLTPAKLKLADTIKQERELRAAGVGQITFAQAAKLYTDRVNANLKLKLKTREYHRLRLEGLMKSWPGLGATKIRNLTKDECIQWANRFAGNYSPSSFNHTLGLLRAVIEVGIEKGARCDNPAGFVERLSEVIQPPKLPSQIQFARFIKAIEGSGCGWSEPCADMVRFLAYGGFRLTEATNVTWGDVDLNKGEIIVRGETPADQANNHRSRQQSSWRSNEARYCWR